MRFWLLPHALSCCSRTAFTHQILHIHTRTYTETHTHTGVVCWRLAVVLSGSPIADRRVVSSLVIICDEAAGAAAATCGVAAASGGVAAASGGGAAAERALQAFEWDEAAPGHLRFPLQSLGTRLTGICRQQ